MELPNRLINGKYYYVDENNAIIREATEEEAKALERSLIVDAQEQAQKPLTIVEVLQMLIPQQINTLTVDDNTALRMVGFYPEWEPGKDYAAAFKVQRSGRLWRCIQAHTAGEGWEPENAASLWEQINETHSGELSDPIPYNGNMALTAGLYYIQDGRIYLCIRDTVSPVHNSLAELLGLYVEAAA
jgi:hypothetical protein